MTEDGEKWHYLAIQNLSYYEELHQKIMVIVIELAVFIHQLSTENITY